MEDKIRRKYNKKGRALLFASLFVLLISVLGLYYFIFAPTWPVFNFLPAKELSPIISSQTSTAALVANDCPDCQPRWLDGILVPANEVNAFPVAVVIDNDVLARPQAGLARASLVYEAPVEGGMTRYLAIFPADIDLEVIGPVRSARPYFVVWAEELRALFVHCGGSPEALARLKADTVYDLNEFYNNAYFWREESDTRSAPHNVLISGNNWRAYLEKRNLGEKKADAWFFKEESDHASSSPDISVRFSANFQSLWRYDAENNEYRRFFNGVVSSDEVAEIRAKNVIIHYSESKILDKTGRLSLNLNGQGPAKICLDGVCQSGYWRKIGQERTRYYYENNEEVKFNPGITWIEVANSTTRVD